MYKTLLAMIVLCGCSQGPIIPEDLVPAYIVETVAVVNDSSGIVIYSDEEKSLILTADHVVDDVTNDLTCSGCYYDGIVPAFLYMESIGHLLDQKKVDVEVFNVEYDKRADLAILEIRPGGKLISASFATDWPELGEEVWLAANPNKEFRSIKNGIVGSQFRRYKTTIIWEVSGQIIFGSSGGGAFNRGGQLFGIIQSVAIYSSNQCFTAYNMENHSIENRCIKFPLTDMGYIIPPASIRRFLLESSYANYFEYLE